MSTYATLLTRFDSAAEPVDANEATLADVEAAEALMPDVQYLCNEMACEETPLQVIPFLTPAARREVEQIKVILGRMRDSADLTSFTYQLASLFHYLETHTALARQNYQWCAAVLERACITDTDYRDMRRRLTSDHIDGFSSACSAYYTKQRSTTFKEMHALERLCPYLIDLATKVFSQYNEWI